MHRHAVVTCAVILAMNSFCGSSSADDDNVLVAQAGMTRTTTVDECNSLAASRSDPSRPPNVAGVFDSDVNIPNALAACTAAFRSYPSNPRLAYQLGRALALAGRQSEAVEKYERGASGGHALSMYELADRLYNGGSTGSHAAPDRAVAYARFVESAKAGLPAAMLRVGRMALAGDGASPSHSVALEWLDLAVKAREWRAHEPLALIWSDNKVNGAPDWEMVYEHFVASPHRQAVVLDRIAAAAKSNNAAALYAMSRLYRDGHGVEKNTRLAAEFESRAADAGHPLARSESKASDTARSPHVSQAPSSRPSRETHTRGSAATGDTDSSMLGLSHPSLHSLRQALEKARTTCDALAASPIDDTRPNGISGVATAKIDTAPAIEACELASTGGVDEARYTYQLGRALHMAERLGQAQTAYEKSAEAGHALARNNLGALLVQVGRPEDHARAVELYRKAAEQGVGIAMRNLANAYKKGEIVQANPSLSLTWYKRAAEQGDIDSIFELAQILARGDGSEPHHEEAKVWYRKAAHAGHTSAMINLGALLVRERPVIAANREEAQAWFLKAAEAGIARAMYNLAGAIEWSAKTEADYKLAARWLLAALQKGDDVALQRLKVDAQNWHEAVRRELKNKLHALGVYSGPADGDINPTTIASIERVFGSFKGDGVPANVVADQLPAPPAPSLGTSSGSQPAAVGSWIGVSIKNVEVDGSKVILVQSVNRLGPSFGKLAPGMHISAINGIRTETTQQFVEILSRMRQRTVTRLEVLGSNKSTAEIEVTTAGRPPAIEVTLTCPAGMTSPPEKAMFFVLETARGLNPVDVAADEINRHTGCTVESGQLRELVKAYGESQRATQTFAFHAQKLILEPQRIGPPGMSPRGQVGNAGVASQPLRSDSRNAALDEKLFSTLVEVELRLLRQRAGNMLGNQVLASRLALFCPDMRQDAQIQLDMSDVVPPGEAAAMMKHAATVLGRSITEAWAKSGVAIEAKEAITLCTAHAVTYQGQLSLFWYLTAATALGEKQFDGIIGALLLAGEGLKRNKAAALAHLRSAIQSAVGEQKEVYVLVIQKLQ